MLRIKLEFADMSDDSQSIELYEEVIEDHYYEASSTSPEPSRSPSPSPVSGSAPNPHPEQVVPVPFKEPIPRPQAAQPAASHQRTGRQPDPRSAEPQAEQVQVPSPPVAVTMVRRET